MRKYQHASFCLLAGVSCACSGETTTHVARSGHDASVADTSHADAAIAELSDFSPSPSAVQIPPSPTTAVEFVTLWAGMSESIFVGHIDALNGVPVAEPPFVVTNVQFTVVESLAGTPPIALSIPGGVANGINVLAAHRPNIRTGNSYLVFAVDDRIIAAPIMTSGAIAAVDGNPVFLSEVRVVVSTAFGAKL